MAGELDRLASSTAALITQSRAAAHEQQRREKLTTEAFAAIAGAKVLKSIPDSERSWVTAEPASVGNPCWAGFEVAEAKVRFDLDERQAPLLTMRIQCTSKKRDAYLDATPYELGVVIGKVERRPAFLGTVTDAINAATADLAPYSAAAGSEIVKWE